MKWNGQMVTVPHSIYTDQYNSDEGTHELAVASKELSYNEPHKRGGTILQDGTVTFFSYCF